MIGFHLYEMSRLDKFIEAKKHVSGAVWGDGNDCQGAWGSSDGMKCSQMHSDESHTAENMLKTTELFTLNG